jgi:(5-formylfuran-3-yl)methyl phosphate synthase
MKLLVSVRDAQEARDAVTGGADWIDLKEPLAGALGAVSFEVARAAAHAIEKRRAISAALGELNDWQTSRELLTIPDIQVVKLGLAQSARTSNWQSSWTSAFETCSHQGKKLAAVVYADWQRAAAPSPEAVLECAFRAGGKYLLIDTFDKQGLSSIETLGRERIMQLVQCARQGGLTTVLAGSLRVNDLSFIANLPVDVVAIRGAACRGGRTATLEAAKVRQFRSRLETTSEIAKELNSYLTMRN